MDEYTQGIRTILEYIVYTASYDHVGFFFCKVVDYFSLVVKKILIGDEILAAWLVQVSLVDAVLAAKKRSLDFISRFYFAEKFYVNSTLIRQMADVSSAN